MIFECFSKCLCLTVLLLLMISVNPAWAENNDVSIVSYKYYENEGLSLVYPDQWVEPKDNLNPISADRTVLFQFSDITYLLIDFYFKKNNSPRELPDIYDYLDTFQRLGGGNDHYLVRRKAISYPPYRGVVSIVDDRGFKLNFRDSSIMLDLPSARVFLLFSESKSFDEKYEKFYVSQHFATIANSIKIEP